MSLTPPHSLAQKIVLALLFFYALWTIIETTVFGILETPTLNVPYFFTGAGYIRTIVRGLLSVLIPMAFAVVLWKSKERKYFIRIAFLSSLLLPLVFYLSVTRIERFAPQFSESRFYDVASSVFSSSHRILSKSDVEKELGAPLVKDQFRNWERWSYSFMPSSGFGWSKRVLFFDRQGNLVEATLMNEP